MITNKENQNIEWKESWRDEYLKWVCGYANASGGVLCIGKSDDGKIKKLSQEKIKKLLEDIPNKIVSKLGIIADVNLKDEDGDEYIEIEVEKHPNLISYNGKYYYRSGSTMHEITGKELDKALLKSQGRTWDSAPVLKLSIHDLDQLAIDFFKNKAIQSGRLSKTETNVSNKVLLENMHLFDDDGYLIRAAMLAFYKDPEKWIEGAYIRIGFFGNSDSDLVYQDEIHGPLIQQADLTVDLIYTKYMRALIDYSDITRTETYMFPRDAFREILLNAIVHKDYSGCNPIQISVYNDKLYICNDGQMPKSLQTMENLFNKHSSKPFNPKLANIFFRSGLIETWGRGFDKIKNACNTFGNPLPTYTFGEDDIMVLCKANNKYMQLAKTNLLVQSEQDIVKSILLFCTEPRSFNEIMQHVGAGNRSTFKRQYFDKLVKEGMLEMMAKDNPNSPRQKYITIKSKK